jgi:PAS domain S-box-containing protein
VDPDVARQLATIRDPAALLQGLFSHSPVPFILFDRDGHPLVANPAYRAMFGAVPPPEYSVLRDEVAATIGLTDAVRRAFDGETVQTPTVWYDPKELRHIQVSDANRVAIACTFFPLRDDGGAVEHVAVAFKDVTAELLARERAEAERDRLAVAVAEKEQLARALRESEERLRATLEAAEVGTWEWDILEDRVAWSPNIEAIFGLAPGEFGGTYDAWLALVHPDDRVAVAERVATALATIASYAVELRFIRPDGSMGWQSARGHVVADEHGRPRALRGVVFDVTARHHAEEAMRGSETRYRSFVSQSTEGIWRAELRAPIPIDAPWEVQVESIFRDGYLAECNDTMARMYGFEDAAGLVGVPLDQLLVRDDPRNVAYLRAFVESGYRLEGAESIELDRHGARRIFQNSLVGVVEGGVVLRAWGTQRDVTEQVEARQLAESANRAKDDFLAMLGHELRNPLAPIVTAIELMKMRGDDAFQKERGIIERQVRHVVRLVDDLLDVSRMIQGKVTLVRRPIEIAECLATAIELSSPLFEQRAHVLTVDVPHGLAVSGDPVRLAQVFANLLNNSAKYTPRGGKVEVSAERVDGRVCVRIRDNGIGIRAEMLPRIFELFVQERQALDRSEGGLGLGLAIVRSLVDLHGGTVEARSDAPGGGAELTVWLPLLSEVGASATPPAPHPRRRATTGTRILVVDDNEDAAELIAEGLRVLGHDVVVAYDGPSALAMLETMTPEIALLDIGLPVMDGYELARRIHARAGLEELPLLAVTGYGQASDRLGAAHAGFEDLLVKPVDLVALAAAVTRLTAGPRAALPDPI